jgi:predicted protein tyrosine phosphatase
MNEGLKTDHLAKILFVCAQNKIRSVTAEKMFAGSQRYQVRSRGVGNDARIKLTAGDLGLNRIRLELRSGSEHTRRGLRPF